MAVDTQHRYPILEHSARANPQPIYDTMRASDPIYRTTGPVTGNPLWFFTRYEDVQSVLKDTRFIKDLRNQLEPEYVRRYLPEDPDPTFAMVNRHLLNLDAPDHTRLRNLVHKAFTPRAVRDLQPRIAQICQNSLDEMRAKPEGDLIDDFAYPLPITIIAEMLGVHSDRRDDFRRWTRAFLFAVDMESAQVAVMEFVQYINELIEARRTTRTDDILGALVHVHEGDDRLDHMELLAMVFLLLIAGHETTVNLIGNGMLALMQHRDQLQKLHDDPSLIRSAVEECLRWNGPVECPTTRWASEDITVSGVTIPKGELVFPSLLAANRDPAVFEHPNTFDITRDPNPHIAFGFGAHYCIGAPLARLEGTIAINALVQALPDIRLAVEVDDLEWNNGLLIHGVQALPVIYQ